jgi:hypothetical protein
MGDRAFWALSEHWCNLWPSRCVALRRRPGWLRTFVINPSDPERFLEELKTKAPHVA